MPDIVTQPPLQAAAELARLLPMWPHELTDMSIAGRQKRLALLRRALRAERRRSIGGHWSYDLARHAALLRYYDREMRELAATGAAEFAGPRKAIAGT